MFIFTSITSGNPQRRRATQGRGTTHPNQFGALLHNGHDMAFVQVGLIVEADED